MPDHLFTDQKLAALYDLFSPSDGQGDFGFYLPLVMSADAVLDIGCGTGSLLHRARDRGHKGRLCGIDPAIGMLEQARKRFDIEWVLGDLSTHSFESEFDLIVMSGHAFQVFLEDEELRFVLAAVRSALTPNGQFAFETRNPAAREWERWHEKYAGAVVDADGDRVNSEIDVESVRGDIVDFKNTFTSESWDRPQVSPSTLRFLDQESLSAFLAGAGLAIQQQFGDWDRSPVIAESPEIITIARRIGS